MPDPVVLLIIPQLRRRDVTPGALACLDQLGRKGAVSELQPTFPSLAAPVFASLATGLEPGEHGLIGDAYFDRETRRVVTRPFPDSAVGGVKIWERLHQVRPEAVSLAWFTPNLRGATVDIAAWVDPRDGLTTNPPELAASLQGRFGPYPSPRALPADEPLPRAASAWALKTAAAAIQEHHPELALVRLPALGQIARRHGPDGGAVSRAVVELEPLLKAFLASLPPKAVVLVVTESVVTPVLAPLYPNLVLRDLGLLEFIPAPGGGLDIDTEKSAAFALTDHQMAHVYVNDPSVTATLAAAFSTAHADAIDQILSGRRRARLGLDCPRAGDVVLVACPDVWFAPHWWQRRDETPADFRAGSGLAFGAQHDPRTVLGSLGAPPPSPDYLGVAVSSRADLIPLAGTLAASDIHQLIEHVLELDDRQTEPLASPPTPVA
jgi:predicted AlkP superfamily pyrophosphatase or phosphodiesterase